MSYKLGLVLSMVFVALFFLFGADLITLESVYSSLDAKANNISYLISINGVIDDDFINYVENKFLVAFDCPKNNYPTFGDKVVYKISSSYRPLVISKNEMNVTIQRMTIIGFYG